MKDSLKSTLERFKLAGIKELIITPTVYLDYNARPQLFVSYKQFDKLMKIKSKGRKGGTP